MLHLSAILQLTEVQLQVICLSAQQVRPAHFPLMQAQKERFLLLQNCCCLSLAPAMVAISSSGKTVMALDAHSAQLRPLFHKIDYVPSALQERVRSLGSWRNSLAMQFGLGTVLSEVVADCCAKSHAALRRSKYTNADDWDLTHARVIGKHTCPFTRRVKLDLQYSYRPLNCAERRHPDLIADITVSHIVLANTQFAKLELHGSVQPPELPDVSSSRDLLELHACRSFFVENITNSSEAYPTLPCTVAEKYDSTTYIVVRLSEDPAESHEDICVQVRAHTPCTTF
jgi:hypothetical protein